MCTANEVVSLLPLLTLCYIIKYIIYEPFTFNESGVLPIFYPHFSILLPHCPRTNPLRSQPDLLPFGGDAKAKYSY